MELVKPSTEKEEKNPAMEEHKNRAAAMAVSCAFTEGEPSDKAKEACKMIEAMFEEIVYHLSLTLPPNFRTALCLEHMETACLFAKKSIHTHDKQITDKENIMKEKNDSDINKN